MPKKVLQKDSAGAINSARDLVSQLQDQAKNGQIDGAMLDQLQAILNVSVDTAEDAQSSLQSGASSVTDVATAPSATSVPTGSSSPEMTKGSEESSSSTEETPMEEDKEVSKVEEPLSARPPGGAPNLIFDEKEEVERKLPEFIKAMESGSMKLAQQIAGDSSVKFDTMFNAAQLALLREGGWTSDNIENLTAKQNTGTLQKAITASSVPGIYLIRLAKLMLPVYAGLVNRLPVDAPKGMSSNQAIWKAQLGFGSITESDYFRIAEAAIGVEPPTDFLTFTTAYNDLTVNDNVTLKAIRAAQGYSDPLQISVVKAMSSLLRGQERVILGGNKAAIAAPTSVTATAGSTVTGGQLAIAGSYVVGITALTYEGWLASTKGGTGTRYGEGTPTYSASVVPTGNLGHIDITWPAVPGAVAYNVYLSGSATQTSVAGSATCAWLKQVTVNSTEVHTLPTSGSIIQTADTSVNATYGIEGLIAWCEKATIYSQVIPDKVTITDNAGAALTAGNGGITQFDTILASMWTTWHTAPSLMVTSPLMNATLVGKLQSLGSGTFYRVDVTNERNTVNGGMMVTGYVNKFAPFADGTPRMIDVIPHPYMPDGTVLFVSETIPYPMGNESRGFVRDVLLPYTYFPLPSQAAGVNKITYNFAVTTSEVLECFNPGPQAALVCVDHTT